MMVRQRVVALALACLLVGLAGCRTVSDVGGVREDRVHHVVLCWLNEPGDQAGRDRIVAASREFASIPGVRRVRVGTAVPSERAIVDDSFDVGIVLTFDTTAQMQAYLVHPDHVAAVGKVLKPLVKKILVYDIRE